MHLIATIFWIDNQQIQNQAMQVLAALEQNLVIQTCSFFKPSIQAKSIRICLNRSLSIVAVENNIENNALMSQLCVHLCPFSHSDTSIRVSNVFISNDGTSLLVNLPGNVKSNTKYLLCLVHQEHILVGIPAIVQFSEQNFTILRSEVLESIEPTPQLQSMLGLKFISPLRKNQKSRSESSSFVTIQKLASVSHACGMSALHIAAALNHVPLCLMLLNNHFDCAKTDSYGRTPADVAKQAGNDTLSSFLKDHCISDNDESSINESFLMMLFEQEILGNL